ncbi:hypothetical protein V8E36_002107 [Tilletia maclaganii]
MVRFLTLFPAFCLATVFHFADFTTAQGAPGQQQLCARSAAPASKSADGRTLLAMHEPGCH